MGVVCFDTCSPACVSNRQAGEPAKKRELLKVMERVAMWQAMAAVKLGEKNSGCWLCDYPPGDYHIPPSEKEKSSSK